MTDNRAFESEGKGGWMQYDHPRCSKQVHISQQYSDTFSAVDLFVFEWVVDV